VCRAAPRYAGLERPLVFLAGFFPCNALGFSHFLERLVSKVGHDHAGVDAVDIDFVTCQFQRQAFRQADGAVLGGGISGAARYAVRARERAEDDDFTALAAVIIALAAALQIKNEPTRSTSIIALMSFSASRRH